MSTTDNKQQTTDSRSRFVLRSVVCCLLSVVARAATRARFAVPVFAFAGVVTLLPMPARHVRVAQACAFVDPPTTYETTEDRKLYMQAMDLAGFDMLFPDDTFFSQRSIEVGTRDSRQNSGDVYVPPTLLKAISWVESVTSQGSGSLPFGAIGPALVSFDCGYGIAQVTSGMTQPLGESNQPTDQQALVATHFAYNIGRGAAILIDKWNSAPEARPIAGIDTNSDPHILENWYFALWSYNGFTGPGANRSNHPLDPVYGAWPRTAYSCGPQNDGLGHNRSNYPYQEIVLGCASHPPVVQGQPLWKAQPVSLPDLNNPYWRSPLDLQKFQYPYSQMDIPTPKPQHNDSTPKPDANMRAQVLGSPSLGVDRVIALVTVRPGQSATPTQIRISNTGTGIAPWRISSNKSWIKVSQQAGVAVGSDMPCSSGSPCDRSTVLTISADPTKVLGSDAALLHIQGLGPGGRSADVAVFVKVTVAIGIPGTTRN
jgi:hypothetical protein